MHDVECDVVDLPDDVLGLAFHDERRIEIAEGLLQVERRCVLAHELVHLERGPCAGHHAREESAVDHEAARRLITLEALTTALLWSQDEHELADELWVDVAMVRARLAGLTTIERDAIERRFSASERWLDSELSDPFTTVE